ncbi:hypothetical protein C8039_11730 [Halogeometricum sp. wsp3]|nr:hypothetical protein C8039_11730 [Halogeometricum sp. wsp3]
MHVYASGDETAYVWKTTWASEADAREFADAWAAVTPTGAALEPLKATGSSTKPSLCRVLDEINERSLSWIDSTADI